MKKATVSALTALLGLSLSSHGASVQVALTADVGSSSTSGFNGNVPALLSDTFAYDIDNPTLVPPDQAYTNAPPGDGFHGNSTGPNFVLDFSPITLGAGQTFFVDFYGRADCCWDRDDSFTVQTLTGGAGDGVLGTLVLSTLSGIPGNAAPQHVRFAYTDTNTFDSINVIGAVNNFTMMEVRAGIETIPEPSSAMLGLFGVAGLFLRRRR